MSEIRVNKVIDEAGTGAVELTQGATLPSGKTISGSGTIAVNSSGTAAGLTGTPNIVVGSVQGTTGTFSGNVSVGGTLTYEDVTNVDSVGIVTARAGVDLNGTLREKTNVVAGKLSDNLNIDTANGMVHLFTTQETTTSTPNIRVNGSTSLNSVMAIGETISVTLITTAAAGGYSAELTIDGNAVTENWTGGTAPAAGGSSGVDVYAYTIIKTADATFTVIASLTKTSV